MSHMEARRMLEQAQLKYGCYFCSQMMISVKGLYEHWIYCHGEEEEESNVESWKHTLHILNIFEQEKLHGDANQASGSEVQRTKSSVPDLKTLALAIYEESCDQLAKGTDALTQCHNQLKEMARENLLEKVKQVSCAATLAVDKDVCNAYLKGVEEGQKKAQSRLRLMACLLKADAPSVEVERQLEDEEPSSHLSRLYRSLREDRENFKDMLEACLEIRTAKRQKASDLIEEATKSVKVPVKKSWKVKLQKLYIDVMKEEHQREEEFLRNLQVVLEDESEEDESEEE